MELQTYNIKQDRDSQSYEFTSTGSKGDISKLVLYQETSIPNLFNLAFGDYNSESGDLDDVVVTDNGDGEKVLATVVSTIHHFSPPILKQLSILQAVPLQELGYIESQ